MDYIIYHSTFDRNVFRDRKNRFLLPLAKCITEVDEICDVKNDTLYIGNCTNKFITGLRDTFQKSRRGQGRLSLRNYAEFLKFMVPDPNGM